MLVTSEELYQKAKIGKYAIPAANFIDFDSMKWHIETAQEMRMPIIIALAECHICSELTVEAAALLGRKYAGEADVPVVLHLDHGMTISVIKQAVDCGFTSVMIDASAEKFEVNTEKTKEIVSYAHQNGVVVEAEIGHVGAGENYENHDQTDSVYTSVEEAVRFAELTNVDSLAISIGTAHGLYKGVPQINFERLREISEAVDIPLVLHGGSSSGDDNLHQCAVGGIQKINIFSDFLVAAEKEAAKRKAKSYLDYKEASKAGMKGCLKHYFEVFATQVIE